MTNIQRHVDQPLATDTPNAREDVLPNATPIRPFLDMGVEIYLKG